MECTKYVRVQAWTRACEQSVYVVCVPGWFIKWVVTIMAMCYCYGNVLLLWWCVTVWRCVTVMATCYCYGNVLLLWRCVTVMAMCYLHQYRTSTRTSATLAPQYSSTVPTLFRLQLQGWHKRWNMDISWKITHEGKTGDQKQKITGSQLPFFLVHIPRYCWKKSFCHFRQIYEFIHFAKNEAEPTGWDDKWMAYVPEKTNVNTLGPTYLKSI